MKKKILVTLSVVACALLLVVGSVVGTVAYLTSTTAQVKNTFTAGNVTITLDEAKVDQYGVATDATNDRVDGTNSPANTYKLIPGHRYTKDPTIHVGATSEDCYLFVKVVNGLDGALDTATIESQMATNGWTPVADQAGVYQFNGNGETLEKVAAGTDVVVFKYFKLLGTADVAAYTSAAITVQAYAVQADGFENPAAAWAAAPFTGWTA